MDGRKSKTSGYLHNSQPAMSGGITGVRLGYNPNSSSLGTAVTTLIWGSLLMGIVSPLIGSFVRIVRLRNRIEVANGNSQNTHTD